MTTLRRSTAAVLLALAGCKGGATSSPEQEAINRELQSQIWPLLTVDGALDVSPLWEMTRAARLVGIGEASPGVREFRKLMNLMVEQAARDDKPLVVAIDVPFADGLWLDAWVGDAFYPPDPGLKRHRIGVITPAFDPHYLSFNREHLQLFAWLRTYNDGAPPERDIRVVGLGGCTDTRCLGWLASYLAKVDPQRVDDVRRLTAALRLDGTLASAASLPDARQQLDGLHERLLAAREQYVAAAGAPAHDAATWLLGLVARRLDPDLPENASGAKREPGAVMADTVGWIAERSPGARLLLLANNAHTDRALPGAAPNMGRLLTERFPDNYVAVHTTFNRGFAFDVDGRRNLHSPVAPGVQGNIKDTSLTGWAPGGTLEDTLQASGDGYALDVRTAVSGGGELSQYLHGTLRTRWYPDTWRGAFGGGPWTDLVPAKACDVLVYVTNAIITR